MDMGGARVTGLPHAPRHTHGRRRGERDSPVRGPAMHLGVSAARNCYAKRGLKRELQRGLQG